MRIVRQLFGPSTTRLLGRFTPAARRLRPSPSSVAAAVGFCLVAAVPAVAADPAAAPVANRPLPAPPEVVNFGAAYTIGNVCVISGDVIAANPAGLTVSFGGAPVSLQGLTAVTDANGHFSITVTMNGMRSDVGLATAQTVDAFGQKSNLALDYIPINN